MADTNVQDELNKTVTSFREKLVYEASDEELLRAINKAVQESFDVKSLMDKVGVRNKKYWKFGTEKDLSRLHPKKSRITSNRIFTDVETAIPILTSEPPEPTVLGDIDTTQKAIIQEGLKLAYEVKYKLQQKLQQMIRHWFLYRIGVLKYRWDKDKGFITEPVLPKKIGMDKRATNKDNCEYVYEDLEDTLENLQEKFPKKKEELKNIAGGDNPKTKLKYLEFWGGGGEWLCWKIRDVILDKIKNPNFDYENSENNLFEKPSFPYIFLNVMNTGDENGLYDDVSLIEEAAPLQEGVNQLEQQILDLNEGQKRVWVAAGEAMSEAKAQDLVDKTGDLMVYLDRKASPGAVGQVQSGKPDASLFNHLAHLLSEIDNVMGIHSTTRGERTTQKTKYETQVLQGSDYGRLDLIVRNMEQVVEEWFNAYLHMLKVYSLEAEVLYDKQGQKVEISREQIPAGIIIMIKKGSTLPTDDMSKRTNAIQLAQFGMIDPATLFEEMSYPNIEKKVQALYQWLQLTGKIAPQQPQMPAVGQSGGPQGGSEGDMQKLQQVQRLKQVMQNVKQLPPEEQQQAVGQVAQLANQLQ